MTEVELSFRGLRETCGFPKNLAPRLRRTCHVLPQTLRGAAGRRPGWHGPAQEDSPPRATSVSAEPPTLPGKTSSFHASFSKRTVLSGRGASTERKLGCGRHQRGENAFPARANHRGKAPARPWVQRPRGCSGPRTGNQGRRGAGDPRGPAPHAPGRRCPTPSRGRPWGSD